MTCKMEKNDHFRHFSNSYHFSNISRFFLASFYIKQILDACRVSMNRHKAMIQNVSFLFLFGTL